MDVQLYMIPFVLNKDSSRFDWHDVNPASVYFLNQGDINNMLKLHIKNCAAIFTIHFTQVAEKIPHPNYTMVSLLVVNHELKTG